MHSAPSQNHIVLALLHVSPMAAPAVVDAARKAQAEKEKKKGS